MQPALRLAIDGLYNVLGRYVGPPVDPVWQDAEQIEALLRRPLREITLGELESYVDSASGRVGAWRDVRHFLPRILDVASTAEASNSFQLSWGVLRGLVRAAGDLPAPPWTESERTVLKEFVGAFLPTALDDPTANWADDDLLLLGADLGLKMEPVLERIYSPRTTRAVESLRRINSGLRLTAFGPDEKLGDPNVRVDPCIRSWLLGVRPVAALEEAMVRFESNPEAGIEVSLLRDALVFWQERSRAFTGKHGRR